jgi:hypothetical protein
MAQEVRRTAGTPEIAAIAEACIVAVVVFLLGGFFSLEIIARDTIPVFWTLAGTVLSVYSSLSLAPGAEKRQNAKRHRFRFAAITANTAPGTSSQ